MSTRFFCDLCNEEMAAEEYREPRPNRTTIIVPFEGTMCKKCVDTFMGLNVSGILKSAVLDARPDIPKPAQQRKEK